VGTEVVASRQNLIASDVRACPHSDTRPEDAPLAYHSAVTKKSTGSNHGTFTNGSIHSKLIVGPEVRVFPKARALLKGVALLEVCAFLEMAELAKVVVAAEDGVAVEDLFVRKHLFAPEAARPIE